MKFKTFWGAGFDSISPLVQTESGLTYDDLIRYVEHDKRVAEDYALLSELGISWIREDIRWHLCVKENGTINFDHLLPMLEEANKYDLDIMWSWMHYGAPVFANPIQDDFAKYLLEVGNAHLEWLKKQGVNAKTVSPINEPSFYAWMAGDAGKWFPFETGNAPKLKASLIEAHKKAFDLISEDYPDTQVVLVDPFYYVVGGEDDGSQADAAFWRKAGLEAMDALRKHTHILGINFYEFSQHESYCNELTGMYERRELSIDDPRRINVLDVYRFCYERYGLPMILTETSVVSDDTNSQHEYLQKLTDLSLLAVNEGMPIQGLCWYPALSNPNWLSGYLGENKTLENMSDTFVDCGLIQLRKTDKGFERYLPDEIKNSVKMQELRLQKSVR